MIESNISAIVAAAGSSSRFGSPKMLYRHKEAPLIAHTLKALGSVKFKSIVVVTGKHTDAIMAVLDSTKLHYTQVGVKEKHEMGLGCSIAAGVNEATRISSTISAALIILGDQIFVTSNDIEKLVLTAKANPESIVCSRYNNTLGAPCIMPKSYFSELHNLSGDHGAKAIIQNNQHNCLAVDLPNAGNDIDRKEDLNTNSSP